MDKQIKLSLENIVNNSNGTLEQKKEAYLKMAGLEPNQGEVVVEDGRIIGFKMYCSVESIAYTITLDKN